MQKRGILKMKLKERCAAAHDPFCASRRLKRVLVVPNNSGFLHMFVLLPEFACHIA